MLPNATQPTDGCFSSLDFLPTLSNDPFSITIRGVVYERGRNMREIKLSPSLMCADLVRLSDALAALENAGVDLLHIDVMDGEFVPNIAFGTDFIRRLQGATKLPLDIHLMIERPEDKIDWFPVREGDYLAVHAEATRHLQRALAKIKQRGALAGVAINPGTPICALEEVLGDLDFIVLMTVNPGFAGQKMVKGSLDKIARTRAFLDSKGLQNVPIEVDGNVSFENGALMARAGADILVGGSSSVFDKGGDIAENVRRVRDGVKGL